MTRLKILQIVSNMPDPPIGGIESVVFHLSKGLKKKGHEVSMITSAHCSEIENKLIDGVQVVYVPAIELNSRIRFLIPKCLGAVRDLIINSNLVHVHNVYYSFNLTMAFLSKFARKFVITSVLSCHDLLKHPNPFVRVGAFSVEVPANLLIRSSDIIHVKNPLDYARLNKMHDRVIYIPDGIPDEYFHASQNPVPFRRKVRVAEENKLILYVGRLHPLKGPQVLVKAMKYIVKEEAKVICVIVGPGQTYQAFLRKLVLDLGLERNVLLAGILTEKEKMSAYDAAYVVVVPSCSDVVEAYSLVASEAWARKNPVVASAVGALKYRVRSGVDGYLAKPNDPKDLAEKILRALNLKVNGIPADVRSWNEVTRKFDELYKTVAA